MNDKISLKLDEKALRKSNSEYWIAAPLICFGACWISYKFFIVKAPEPKATSAMFLGSAILLGTIWAGKLVWSQIRLHQRQLRDGVTIYELTPNGITNHRGDTQRWSGLKKIYFRGNAVFFSYMTFNRSSAFRMNSTGIDPAKFYEACEFIKHHAPKEVTVKFNLDKIPKL